MSADRVPPKLSGGSPWKRDDADGQEVPPKILMLQEQNIWEKSIF